MDYQAEMATATVQQGQKIRGDEKPEEMPAVQI
jgi:hypothetical protein